MKWKVKGGWASNALAEVVSIGTSDLEDESMDDVVLEISFGADIESLFVTLTVPANSVKLRDTFCLTPSSMNSD